MSDFFNIVATVSSKPFTDSLVDDFTVTLKNAIDLDGTVSESELEMHMERKDAGINNGDAGLASLALDRMMFLGMPLEPGTVIYIRQSLMTNNAIPTEEATDDAPAGDTE